MISEEQRETLIDIFENHEVPEKMHIELDPVSRDVTIKIEHLDSEWFKELSNM